MNIDTNILIEYFAGEKDVVGLLDSVVAEKGFVVISSIVYSEILSYNKLTKEEYDSIKAFLLDNFTIINVDIKVAEVASQIRRYKLVKLPDACIAATSIVTNTKLFTRNLSDFKYLEKLDLLYDERN